MGRYPKIVMWWEQGSEATELIMTDVSIEDAKAMAIQHGYKPPVWYKPWRYITGGLGIVTVGFAY